MTTNHQNPVCLRDVQFSLASLFEFTSVSAILAALSSMLGVLASLFLMLMALGLMTRQGWLALAALMACSLAGDWSVPVQSSDGTFGRQILVLTAAGALCAWCCWRRRAV